MWTILYKTFSYYARYRSHTEISSIFTYNYIINFRIHLSFFILFSSFLEALSHYLFYTFMLGIHHIHILVTFIRGKRRLHILSTFIGGKHSLIMRAVASIQKLVAYSLTTILSLILRGCLKYSIHSSGANIFFISSLHSSGANIFFIYARYARSHPEISNIHLPVGYHFLELFFLFFILFLSFLEALSYLLFTHSSGQTLYFISSLHSSRKTFPSDTRYIHRGKTSSSHPRYARSHPEMSNIFTIQLVITF